VTEYIFIQRILSRIHINDSGCWEWTGAKNQFNYGRIGIYHRLMYPHRLMFEYYYGQICSDLSIDHLCRNPKCCNPKHLEQVTIKENIYRGNSPPANNKRKTHCPIGHSYSSVDARGFRKCKICSARNYKNWSLLHRRKGVITR